jgi:ferrochelatase
MKFVNTTDFSHSSNEKVGILLTNLGTPDAPEPKPLRRYLKQFLSDPRVVEFPRLAWWLILNLIILNIRPARSAKAYKTVWTEEGSPLLTITKQQTQALQREMGDEIVVDFAMRYGNPSVDSVVDKMLAQGVRKLLVLPLYPQYSASTTASTFDAIAECFRKRRWLPELRFVTHYHDDPGYIKACAERIKLHRDNHPSTDLLIFSYHGIPQRYLRNGDPYHCECHKTSRLIAAELGLDDSQYRTTFQSRFGREPWLQPYTDETLKNLPSEGIKKIAVFCPGFSADCLETIEEIGEENHEYFMHAGGTEFQYIPALNDFETHIHALADLARANLQGWQVDNCERDLQVRMAKSIGASS